LMMRSRCRVASACMHHLIRPFGLHAECFGMRKAAQNIAGLRTAASTAQQRVASPAQCHITLRACPVLLFHQLGCCFTAGAQWRSIALRQETQHKRANTRNQKHASKMHCTTSSDAVAA
jgi:hypothetical protein